MSKKAPRATLCVANEEQSRCDKHRPRVGGLLSRFWNVPVLRSMLPSSSSCFLAREYALRLKHADDYYTIGSLHQPMVLNAALPPLT